MDRRLGQADLFDLLGLEQLSSLALIGLGKNAGKTSVLNHLIRAFHEKPQGRSLALTSVGRDGEGRDLVTGGHKPRIFVHPGDLIATGRQSIPSCDAVLEILELSGLHTAAGEVVLARAVTGGLVELAGPSLASDLKVCEKLFRRHDPSCLFLVDGALDRRSQAGGGLTQALVLAAGMANADSMDQLALQVERQVLLLTLPALDRELAEPVRELMDRRPKVRALALDGRGGIRSLLEADSLAGCGGQAAEALEEGDRFLVLRGALTDRLIQDLLTNGLPGGLTLVAEDGTRLFLTQESLDRLQGRGVQLAVLHRLALGMVSLNPMRRDGSLADSAALLAAVRSRVKVPVLDLGPAPGFVTGQEGDETC